MSTATSTTTKVALYLRVSGDRQTTENQRPEIVQLARARAFDVVALYEETGSAAKHRAAFEKMMVEAHAGRFEVLIVWSIDRFGRSMVGNLQSVLELDRIGVQVISVREPGSIRAALSGRCSSRSSRGLRNVSEPD